MAYKGSGKKGLIQGAGGRRSSYGKKPNTGFSGAINDLFKTAKRVTKKTHNDSIKSNRNPKRNSR